MSSDAEAVSVRGIGKCYRMYDEPSDRLKQMLWGRYRSAPYGREFWAVKDLSLGIRKGETLGIIGRNGCGKSTTLQMIAGTLEPTTGEVETRGRVAALLELGSGFNPEYTGRDNILLYGSILGITAERMAAKLDSIIAFADIGDFIGQPVKTYSSGMAVRLAFSVAVHVDPDVLIIDEALSVGDARFQQKCLRAIDDLRTRAAVLMVTHDISALKSFCHTALWMHGGRIRATGTADAIATAYLDECHGTNRPAAQAGEAGAKPSALPPVPPTCVDKGTRDALITHAGFVDAEGNPLHEPPPGKTADYRLLVTGRSRIDGPLIIGLTMTNRLGQEIFAINSLWADGSAELRAPEPGLTKVFRLRFTMPDVNHGSYCISPALATGAQAAHSIVHWVHDATIVQVPSSPRRCLPGILSLNGYEAGEVT